jgi:multiple sugar transport system permease protein
MAISLEDRPAETAVPSPGSRAPKKRARRTEHAYAVVFLGPQLFGLIAFMIGPLVFAIFLSFTHWDGFGKITLAGFSNYEWALTDPQIRRSALNTLWFTALQLPSLLICGFIAAYLMQKTPRLRGLYRTLFFAPQVTSSVAVAAIWLWLFNPDISPVNHVLAQVGISTPNWLQDTKTMILSFAIVGLWQGLGYQIVMFAAGLEAIPRTILEAATIDGASQLQKLRLIIVPLLSPTILFLSITGIIGSFQIFDYIYVFMDTGAPPAARTIVYEIVQVAFREFEYGRGCALAVLLFLFLLAITGLQLIAQRKWVHYTE